MQAATLAELAQAWKEAKAEEIAANERRLTIEAAILEHMEAKTEGTSTDKETGVIVTYKITRSVDSDAVKANWLQLSANAQAAFKATMSLDTKTFKDLQKLDATSYAQAAAYVTAKPAKPSISIKE